MMAAWRLRGLRAWFFSVLCMVTLAGKAEAGWTQLYQKDGNVGLEIRAFPSAGSSSPSGTITLSTIPAGATIDKAYLIGNDWNTGGGASAPAKFAGHNLAVVGAFDSDNSYLRAFQWDVTSYVTGNGSYSASSQFLVNSYGLALAVVYSHPSLPFGRATINGGATILPAQSGSTATSFSAFGGTGELWVYTQADDNFTPNSSGERVLFNGANVGGPLDANLGSLASVLTMNVTTLGGLNTANITTNSDTFGWHLAGLHSVPEPASAGMLILAGIGLGRRRGKMRLCLDRRG